MKYQSLRPVPEPGANSQEILTGMEYCPAEIAAMKEVGAYLSFYDVIEVRGG
jgi:hypothetical protein